MPKIKHQIEIHNNVMDKQDELQKKSTTYSTKKIEDIQNAILEGGKPDTTPFFHGQPEWKDHGIIFEYTDEELEELQKCSVSCEYFVEHYCKFLNSKGRTLVKLRDYQKRILNVMGSEKWDPKSEAFVPLHGQICLMQARQTSKCLSGNTLVSISYEDAKTIIMQNNEKYKCNKTINKNSEEFYDIALYEIYFSKIKNPTFNDILTYHLYRLNDKCNSSFISKCIYWCESKKFKNLTNEKIIETFDCNFKISSANGYNECIYIHRTKPFETYELLLEDGTFLFGADNHLVYADIKAKQDWTYICDIKKNEFIYTKNGWKKVLKNNKKSYKLFMYDISLHKN